MKRILLISLLIMLCSFTSIFATEEDIDYFSNDEVDVSVGEGYTNDMIYTEDLGDVGWGNLEEETADMENLSLKAKVIEVSEPYKRKTEYEDSMAQDVKVEVTDKRHRGEKYDVIYYLEDDYNTRLPMYAPLKVGDPVCVYVNLENGVLVGDAFIQYYDKTGWFILLASIFAVAIVLIGGVKGIKALIGLIFTVVLVFTVLIPGILDGKDPIMLATIVSILTIIVTFLIISGFHKKTVAAIVGTFSGVLAAALIGGVFTNIMTLTGINEHARMISVSVPEEQKMFNFQGIMLSGIMISALGACMDVGMSIASALHELKCENPKMTKRKLIASGMNIGKDVMGTMTNTLILAYVGGAMCCILLYTINGFDLHTVINQEDISIEVLQSLSGSIGLVCTIPLTALVSGLIMGTEFKSNKKIDDDEVKIRYFKG